MRRIDLHSHTWYSDGSLSPTELVSLAAETGLAALAVTDHDATDGLAEARAAGERLGVEVIDGCEVSTSTPASVVHILAYAFDPHDAAFQALLARVRNDRQRRNEAMLERLEALGMPLRLEEVARHAVGRIVARPHFAQALLARGWVESVREAFDRFLRDGGPAWVRVEMPRPEEAIAAAAAAGGVTVLAHPRQMKLESERAYREAIGAFAEAGLAGVEVDHASNDATHRLLFRAIADDLGLVASGGSDFHGAAKPHIRLGEGDGSITVPYETWERLRERRGAPPPR
jgi:predicted metal-dependent phosphoesterase TrpH